MVGVVSKLLMNTVLVVVVRSCEEVMLDMIVEGTPWMRVPRETRKDAVVI